VEPDQPLWIRSAPAKLSRILLNLLGNAIKFTDSGSVTVTMAVLATGSGQRLTVRVTDTGVGVAPELREAIFGDFVQADDSITRRFGGVGLGLAISRRLAAQLDGTLHLESPAAIGSSFCLDIPAAPGTEHDSTPLPQHKPHSLRVLVVDDDEINLLVADRLLAHLGQQVSLATNGEEAIAALAASDYDTVLMDLRMPGMDCMETARHIRRQEATHGRRKTRIVAMSAEITDDIWRQCQQAGMDGAVAKPVRIEQLRDALGIPAALPAPVSGVDSGFVQEQVDILGPREMVRLARMFQRVSRDMMRAMTAAASAADRPAIGALAHRLASAAGPLGLTDVTAQALRLEAASATASPDALRDQIARLGEARRAGLAALGVFARTPAKAPVTSAR
jgi:CheY-like chemotaxis protein